MTRVGFSLAVGVWLGGMLYLMTRTPWVAVFACGFGLGWVLLDNWAMQVEMQERQAEVAELEKQVVALRSSMHEMHVGMWKDGIRGGRQQLKSLRSFKSCMSL